MWVTEGAAAGWPEVLFKSTISAVNVRRELVDAVRVSTGMIHGVISQEHSSLVKFLKTIP